MITEFVKFKLADTATEEGLISAADVLNDFQKNEDGFIDGELVKNVGLNEWCFVYRYRSLKKLKLIGEKIRSSKIFDVFNPLIIPGSLSVSFNVRLKRW
jgi:hypothetical protein